MPYDITVGTVVVTVSDEDVLYVRRNIGNTTLTDLEIATVIANTVDDQSTVDPNASIAIIWREKAASYAELVDVSESGSSRKMSDLHKNAIEMAKQYDGMKTVVEVDFSNRPRTRAIERP